MDEARVKALDFAVTAVTLVRREDVPAAEIVATAEAFHRFLTGGPNKYYEEAKVIAELSGRDIEARLDVVKQQVASDAVPPPLPAEAFGRISNHDLAKSDQTPLPTLTTEDGYYAVGDTDTDHIPTRLVRTPSDAA